MAEMKELLIDGRRYRKFIRWPAKVADGTVRCFACGQIDEPEHHDAALCPALRALIKDQSNG